MASRTVRGPWPEGTTVKAYPALAFAAGASGPTGPATATSTADSEGEVEFTGLEQWKPYVAWGGGRQVRFLVEGESDAGRVSDRNRINAIEEGVGTSGANVVVMREAPLNLRYPEYEALVEGSRWDAALAAAVADLPEDGGEIFAHGAFVFDEPLPSLDGSVGVTLRGSGSGATRASERTVFIYTGSGTDPFLSAQTSQKLLLEDIDFVYNNNGFTGHLLDLRGTPPNDTMQPTLRRVFLGANPGDGSLATAQSLLRLVGSHTIELDQVSFAGAVHAIWGLEEGNIHSVNSLVARNCLFNFAFTDFQVRNPGVSWKFDTCSFEQCLNGEARAIYSESNALQHGSLTIDNCWMGDVTAAGGDWIRTHGDGLVIVGGYADLNGSRLVSVESNDVRGLAIIGTAGVKSGALTGGALVNFRTTTGHQNVLLFPGALQNAALFTGTEPAGMLRSAGTTLLYGGRVVAAAGLGVGGTEPATTPGSVTRKMPIYDTDGVTLLGFVPLYNTIT
jgi:hypothetical protein